MREKIAEEIEASQKSACTKRVHTASVAFKKEAGRGYFEVDLNAPPPWRLGLYRE